MTELSECVNEIVESKLNQSLFNHDDENNIIEILNGIAFSKTFNKGYREMATNWIYEVNKPSRRFKKITP